MQKLVTHQWYLLATLSLSLSYLWWLSNVPIALHAQLVLPQHLQYIFFLSLLKIISPRFKWIKEKFALLTFWQTNAATILKLQADDAAVRAYRQCTHRILKVWHHSITTNHQKPHFKQNGRAWKRVSAYHSQKEMTYFPIRRVSASWVMSTATRRWDESAKVATQSRRLSDTQVQWYRQKG